MGATIFRLNNKQQRTVTPKTKEPNEVDLHNCPSYFLESFKTRADNPKDSPEPS